MVSGDATGPAAGTATAVVLADAVASAEDVLGRANVVPAGALAVLGLAVGLAVVERVAVGAVADDGSFDGDDDTEGAADGAGDVVDDGDEEVDGEAEGAALETWLGTVTATAFGVRPEGPAAMAEPDCRTTAAVVKERTVTDIQALRRRVIVDPAVFGASGFLSNMSLPAAVAFHRSCDRNYRFIDLVPDQQP